MRNRKTAATAKIRPTIRTGTPMPVLAGFSVALGDGVAIVGEEITLGALKVKV